MKYSTIKKKKKSLKYFLYQVDPYLSIGDDCQVYVKPQADVREYGSSADQQEAISTIFELKKTIGQSDKDLEGVIIQNLSRMTEVCHLTASPKDKKVNIFRQYI